MKKFSVPCDFNGVQSPFTVYIGNPEPKHHPLHFQADWLSRERGGTIPSNIMDTVAKLKDLSEKNNVSFEELCVYALGSAQQETSSEGGESSSEEVEDEVVSAEAEETQEEDGEITTDEETINDQKNSDESK